MVVVCSDPLFPHPSVSPTVKIPDPQCPVPSAWLVEAEETPQKIWGDPHRLNQLLKEISRWNIPLISCATQVQEQ
jgi:hypothetical protein